MNEQHFVDRRERDWQRLTWLCDQAESGIRRLSPEELREFVQLYRRASTDLALARTKSTNDALIYFLNDLTGRAYAILYRAPKRPFFNSVVEAIALSAQTVRRNKWFVLISALIFFGSGFFVYGLASWRPDLREKMAPPEWKEVFDGWKKGQFEQHTSSESGGMTGFYASNNPKAAIVTGAVGAGTFGFLSVYLLFQNGQVLGSLAYEMSTVGKLGFLLSSLVPHGVPELSGIIVSGSVGLVLAWAVINPKRRRRGDSLKAVGKDAIVLLATSVVLMFIAAPIEAFFSFQPTIPQWVKGTVGIFSMFVWGIFWTGFGRSEAERAALTSTSGT